MMSSNMDCPIAKGLLSDSDSVDATGDMLTDEEKGEQFEKPSRHQCTPDGVPVVLLIAVPSIGHQIFVLLVWKMVAYKLYSPLRHV
jgi:hypothetical protein